jgi:hypothetical protein
MMKFEPLFFIPSVGLIPKNSLSRGNFRAVFKLVHLFVYGIKPTYNPFLSEQHTPSACGGVVD